jgi:four helix bundle protein
MAVRRFEDLVAWQLARELERRVYAFTETEPMRRDVEYCRQIRKSSSSAARNLSEGFGRYLPGDFSKFVRNALGSLNETTDHLDAGFERRYLTPDSHKELHLLARRAIGASVNLVKYLESCKKSWRGRSKGKRVPEFQVPGFKGSRFEGSRFIGSGFKVHRSPTNHEPELWNLGTWNPGTLEPFHWGRLY